MVCLPVIMIFSVLFFAACYVFAAGQKQFSLPRHTFLFLLGAGLLLRVLFAVYNRGFLSDTACFAAWADRMFTAGPAHFYSADAFTDYPPGFMYILYVIGAVCSLLHIPSFSGLHLLLLKLPAILCDLACSCLLYQKACKRHSVQSALCLTAAYLFNPAVILNSSLWGQVDSVFTLTVVLLCLYLIEGKMLPAYIAFGIGILLKPQTLVFTPVLLAGILDRVFLQNFRVEKFKKNLLWGLCVLSCMLLVCLPFGLENVITQYTSTLGSYPYVSVNAYNFWALLGKSWVSQTDTFFLFSYAQWGVLVILLIVLFTFIISLRMGEDTAKYPLLGAFTILTMFLFSVRMHERYLYPGLVLLLLYYLYKPQRNTYLCYAGFSLLHFANTAHVLFAYDPSHYNAKAPMILGISVGMVLCIVFFYYSIWKDDGRGKAAPRKKQPAAGRISFLKRGLPPIASAKAVPFTRLDALLLTAILLLYGCFALYDLGDRTAPASSYELSQNESIILDFGAQTPPAVLSYYMAPWHNRTVMIEARETDTESWILLATVTLQNVFTWKDIPLVGSARYLRLTLTDADASLLELVFTDADGAPLLPLNASAYSGLFDEQQLHPQEYTFRNSMYFDEIYHARTAYEYLNGLYSYENTHPPLGKILIALGVAVFGMNPFGWRIVGTLFGIAMLPLLYLFGKKLTQDTPAAALACFLFAFDFMHFVQTRIATIDVYITFFVIAMYYFMYCYGSMSFYDTSFNRTLLPLGLCGISMGLAVACKWTGVYAGLGLAVLFFATLFRRYLEYRYALQQPRGSTCGIAHTTIINCFVPYVKRTIGFCLLFFAAVPATIYLLSYLPFEDASGDGLWGRMLQNQITMFNYHSNLEAAHAFSSPWYGWPLMTRPVWYYSHIGSEHLREGISSFGNPLVWWAGIPAFLYVVYLLIKNVRRELTAVSAAKAPSALPDKTTTALSDKTTSALPCKTAFTLSDEAEMRTLLFLIIGYLAQYLPWFFVTRITFIYHYFPSVAFVVLMIVYCLMQLKKRLSGHVFVTYVIIYGAAALGLFLLFYPVLAGQPVEVDFVEKWLRWFDSWVLVAG